MLTSRITRDFVLRPDEGDGDGTPPPAEPPKAEDKPKDDQSAAFADMRRQLKAAEKAREAAEAKVAEKDRAEAEAQGRWKELAEKSDAKVKELESRIEREQQRASVARIAKRLEFVDPDDAHHFLDDTDMGDEKLAEQALKALAKTKPYLLAKAPTRTGREVSGERDIPKTPDGQPDFAAAAGQAVLARWNEIKQDRGTRTFRTADIE